MPLPYAPQGDLTRTIARDPYRTISRISDTLGADAFHGKLMLRDTVFLTGAENAKLFYGDGLTRSGAAPVFLKDVLFGRGGVQGLDGEEHLRRKALLNDIMNRAAVEELAADFDTALNDFAARKPRHVVVQDNMAELLTQCACKFAGIPEEASGGRARLLQDLFEHAVPTNFDFIKGVTSRRKAASWAGDLISDVRAGKIKPVRGRALDEIASYRTHERLPLNRDDAATELLNVIRPIVAISAYLTFTAHALATQENARGAAAEAPGTLVAEVRRTAPFFPVLTARTAREIEIEGESVDEGTRVVLDIYGTNHDARIWKDPYMFRPSRFSGREVGPFEMIPQGGGTRETGHRCAGEDVTTAIMRTFTTWTTRIDYGRPRQTMDLMMSQCPALPASRMVWEDLHPV